MLIFFDGKEISKAPRKVVSSLGFINETTIHAEMPSSSAGASSSVAVANIVDDDDESESEDSEME